jgi:hypothetical protein
MATPCWWQEIYKGVSQRKRMGRQRSKKQRNEYQLGRYILKAVVEQEHEFFGIKPEWEKPRGLIEGRRAIISDSLKQRARRAKLNTLYQPNLNHAAVTGIECPDSTNMYTEMYTVLILKYIIFLNQLVSMGLWRRVRDSNSRYPYRHAGFQDRCIQPLCQPSLPS